MHIYTCTPIHICPYTHIHIYTHTHIHIYTYTHTHIHIYTYTHTHTYTYTYIHLCTRTSAMYVHLSVLAFRDIDRSWMDSRLRPVSLGSREREPRQLGTREARPRRARLCCLCCFASPSLEASFSACGGLKDEPPTYARCCPHLRTSKESCDLCLALSASFRCSTAALQRGRPRH